MVQFMLGSTISDCRQGNCTLNAPLCHRTFLSLAFFLLCQLFIHIELIENIFKQDREGQRQRTEKKGKRVQHSDWCFCYPVTLLIVSNPQRPLYQVGFQHFQHPWTTDPLRMLSITEASGRWFQNRGKVYKNQAESKQKPQIKWGDLSLPVKPPFRFHSQDQPLQLGKLLPFQYTGQLQSYSKGGFPEFLRLGKPSSSREPLPSHQ